MFDVHFYNSSTIVGWSLVTKTSIKYNINVYLITLLIYQIVYLKR